ncbi:glycosyltransferase family A protein [Pseudoxanthomonas sp. z9]|uniref:glycosyltransferase family A protein n=1 Tax=Pseudoxanthomonas sp. z9 TaxID=2584942 RepID=UPI001144C0A6|nr:glycosyltransferase family A protein [Pseudoxanthomonas sp. z9]
MTHSPEATNSYAVVIPAYNAAATIAVALDSVFAQTVPPCQVIVVDDGSADGERLAEVLAGYGGKVRLLRQANAGPAAARNAGARACEGEWIAFLDADDSWLPHKLERQLELGRDPRAGLLHGRARAPALPREMGFDALWECNRICTSMTVVRRQAFEALGGFDESPELVGAEDYHLWLRIAHAGWRVLACGELIGRYTPAAGSITSRIERCARAELHNAVTLGRTLGVPQARVDAKVRAIRTDFGQHLLHARNIRSARRMLSQALASRVSLRGLGLWSATFVPTPLLDLRRRLRNG